LARRGHDVSESAGLQNPETFLPQFNRGNSFVPILPHEAIAIRRVRAEEVYGVVRQSLQLLQ
jgi:hypothetical protein